MTDTKLPIITEKARQHLIGVAQKQNAKNIFFGVLGGGCAGYSYKWDTISENEIDKKDEIIKLDENINLVLDNYSISFISDCTIDYVEEFSGSHLTVNNPLAASSCGCGNSVGF